ncbi:MAG: hypothetical protein AAB425_07405, partial [Bdellovibrionota bacterium]
MKAYLILNALFLTLLAAGCGKLSATNGIYSAEITLASTSDPTSAPSPCPDGIACVTPTEISGSMVSIVAWIGTGVKKYPLVLQGWKPAAFSDGGSTPLPFNLASPLPQTTEIVCCGDESAVYPSDAEAYITQIEIFPLYLDFQLDTGGPLGTQRLRQVFTD